MKPLLWKEWRENRLIVLWATLLLLVLLIGCLAYAQTSAQSRQVDVGLMGTFLYLTWGLSALLCGSSLVAPEIGLGTLQFLSALPMTRARIWTVKVLMAVLILILCLGGSTLLYAVFYAATLHFGVLRSPLADNLQGIATALPTSLVTMAALFAVSATMTMLVDRPVSALVASLVISIALFSLISLAINAVGQETYSPHYQDQLTVMLLFFIPALLSVSFQTFVRGETLRTSARFHVAAPHFLQSILIVGIALIIAFFWIVL